MNDDRAAKRRAVIEGILLAHLRKRGEAYLEDEDCDDDETPPWLTREQEQARVPAAVGPTIAALRRRYDEADCGTTLVVPMEDAWGPWWFVRTRTDGDDGYAFAFDGSGPPDGAARTYLELCGWDSLDATLAQLGGTKVPDALRKRPSVWFEFMRKRAQQ